MLQVEKTGKCLLKVLYPSDFEDKFGEDAVSCELLYRSNNCLNVDEVEKGTHKAHMTLPVGTRLWKCEGKGSCFSKSRTPEGRDTPFSYAAGLMM